MNRLSFVMQYVTKPRTIGAILPSSKYLAKKMVEDIDFSGTKYIVEYGPGTGVFTDKLIENKNMDTVLLLVEYNNKFYDLLKEKYKNESNLYIINDSAEYIDKYLRIYNIPRVDYVVSGLPFASLPEGVSSEILSKTRSILGSEGKFITFQYTLFKKKFIGRYFDKINIKRELRNIPSAYVFSCNN